MIIIASKPGQLGNRLIVYSSLLAWCMRNNKKLINPSFPPYDQYFKFEDHNNIIIKNGIWKNYKLSYLFARLVWKSGNNIPGFYCQWIDWHEEVNLDKLPSNSSILSKKNTFLQGWKFRANESLNLYKESIRSYFKLEPNLNQKLLDFFKKLPKDGQISIGIHIRRGDYSKFEGGKYFYDNLTYLQFMKRCEEIFESKNIRFIICSNEKIDLNYFMENGLSCFDGPGHEALDLYTLANCDYILGPPSTYTMWASFYGNVPLYMIKDPKATLKKDDFVVQKEF